MGTYLSLIGKRWGGCVGGRLFETGCLLTFSAFRLGAYSRLCAYSNKYGTQQYLPLSMDRPWKMNKSLNQKILSFSQP